MFRKEPKCPRTDLGSVPGHLWLTLFVFDHGAPFYESQQFSFTRAGVGGVADCSVGAMTTAAHRVANNSQPSRVSFPAMFTTLYPFDGLPD